MRRCGSQLKRGYWHIILTRVIIGLGIRLFSVRGSNREEILAANLEAIKGTSGGSLGMLLGKPILVWLTWIYCSKRQPKKDVLLNANYIFFEVGSISCSCNIGGGCHILMRYYPQTKLQGLFA